MCKSSKQFEVEQLRTQNVVWSVEAILMILASLFIVAILPSLLLRYVYTNPQLMEQPKLLEVIPVAGFVIGIGFFLFAMVTNVMRELKARRLQKEVMTMLDSCDCEGGEHHHHSHEMSLMSDSPSTTSKLASALKAKKSIKRKK